MSALAFSAGTCSGAQKPSDVGLRRSATKYLADVFAGLKLLTEALTPNLAILRCSRMPTGSVLFRVFLLGCH